MSDPEEDLPPYAFVPGRPWPHPTGDPRGHSFRSGPESPAPVERDDWPASPAYRRGIALFNAGYYWEAHESWEGLWHAHGRRGPTADLLKGLIKLAAAGVKVRQGQRHGVVTHAARAHALFESVRAAGFIQHLGLNLADLAKVAAEIADRPPSCRDDPNGPVFRVFAFEIRPDPPS